MVMPAEAAREEAERGRGPGGSLGQAGGNGEGAEEDGFSEGMNHTSGRLAADGLSGDDYSGCVSLRSVLICGKLTEVVR